MTPKVIVIRPHTEESLRKFRGIPGGEIVFRESLEDIRPENLYRVRFEYTEEEEGRRILIEYPGD